MNKLLTAIGITFTLAGMLCTFDYVKAQNARTQTNDAADGSRITLGAIGGADAPSVRLAAFIRVSANPTVFRSKGVAAVTSTETGQVCIQPSVPLNVTQIVPVMSVDFSNSLVADKLVEYRSSGIGCPAGNIAVRTLTRSTNGGSLTTDFIPTDNIAFTLIVP